MGKLEFSLLILNDIFSIIGARTKTTNINTKGNNK